MSLPNADLPSPAVLDIAACTEAPLCYRPAAENVLAGDPQQKAWNRFTSADGRFNCGIWEADIGKWRVSFTENEFCYLLAGVVAVTGDDGTHRVYRAGDAFVTPAGFTGTWEVTEAARKYYAVYE